MRDVTKFNVISDKVILKTGDSTNQDDILEAMGNNTHAIVITVGGNTPNIMANTAKSVVSAM